MSYYEDYDEPVFYRPRRARVQQPTWVTRDGESLTLPELEDTHLQNILVYITKRQAEWEFTKAQAAELNNIDLGSMIINNRAAEDWLRLLYAEVRRRQEAGG